MWSDWLVFCDCGFHSVCPLMDKDKGLMEASWWERLRGKLGLVLMGGTMLSKSSIQFSVDGWGCVPSLLFDLRPNHGGGNEDSGDLFQKVLCMHCRTQYPLPCNRSPRTLPRCLLCRRLLDTWKSLGQALVGHCPFLLGPGKHKVCCALHSSVSQSCVSPGSSVVGLMTTSSRRAYAIHRSVHPEPLPVAINQWQELSQVRQGKCKSLSCVWFFATPWTIQSMKFSRPGY